MQRFKSLSNYHILEWNCFCVLNPLICEDFSHLINKEVEIDGLKYMVVTVETFAHLPPYREGERIGLVTNLII